MAGGSSDDIPKFTGISKYFNSYTTEGKRNVVLATYGTIFLIYLYNKLKPSPSPSSEK